MQDKHLILIGDLGVGTNLIKNIFFLDSRYTPPFNYNIINTLYDSKNFENWIRKEYTTRRWRENDISDFVPKNLSLHAETPTIYINHSAFHTPSDLDIILQQPVQVIVLLPELDLSFDWQIRAYIEKVGNVHDFGGETSEMNLVNMYEIMYKRKNEMNKLCAKKEIPILHTDSLYQGNFKKFFADSSSYVNIDYEKAETIYNKWLQCHWDYSQTRQWYFYADRSNF
jgi:hypothetical protein